MCWQVWFIKVYASMNAVEIATTTTTTEKRKLFQQILIRLLVWFVPLDLWEWKHRQRNFILQEKLI